MKPPKPRHTLPNGKTHQPEVVTPPDDGVENITLENIGPVEFAKIPVKPGRVTVLHGTNGAGKSETLDAIRALAMDEDRRAKGEGRLPLMDGAEGGCVRGLGITIKIGRTGANKRTGDLHVVAVEDGFDLSKFVDPGQKDPVAADVRRLKSLASMMGVRIDPARVVALLGGDQNLYDSALKTSTRKLIDAVEYCEAAKRDLEEAAREYESGAEKIDTEITTLRATIVGIDVNQESDAATLAAEVEAAVKHKAALEQKDADADQVERLAKEAEELLKDDGGVTLEQITAGYNKAVADAEANAKEIDRLKQELRIAEGQRDLLARHVNVAREAKESAERREANREEARKRIGAVVVRPKTEELQAAEQAVILANERSIKGAKVREARGTVQLISQKEQLQQSKKATAATLREAASQMVELLAEPVNSLKCGVRITKTMRLVLEGHRRGDCYLSDLSPGEGWSCALGLATKMFERAGVPALLAVPQEAFESLDGHNRRLFLEEVARTKLMVITAIASPEDVEYVPVSAELLEVPKSPEEPS